MVVRRWRHRWSRDSKLAQLYRFSNISLVISFQHVRITSFSWTFLNCLRAYHDDCFSFNFRKPAIITRKPLFYYTKLQKWGATIIIMYYSGDATRSHHSHSAENRYTLGWQRKIDCSEICNIFFSIRSNDFSFIAQST